jgi:hypothetical protein
MVVVPHTKESKSQKVASSMVKEGAILSEERAASTVIPHISSF